MITRKIKTDLYVRIVLTIIAICLIVIIIKPMAIQTAQAGRSEILRVDIVKTRGLHFSSKGIPVVCK